MSTVEKTREIAGTSTLWREAPARTAAPVLYVHGVPTDGDDWLPFLERTGGYAPDLPGFGRSGKEAHFDYSIHGYATWLRAYVDELGLDRFSLVVHDWGVVALALAQAMPERVERLVVMNAVPLLPGYRWPRVARAGRTPGVGEFVMGLTSRWSLRRFTRDANVAPGPMPEEFIERVWESFDQGTQRAILRLYRSAPADVLAAAGTDLGRIGAPGL